MRFGNRAQVRRINNQLASCFDDAAQLVTCLAANPQLIVVLIEKGHDPLVLATGIFDVNITADFG